MKIETALKLILVLLVIIITALVAALFIINDEEKSRVPETQTSTEPDATTPEITTPEITTPEITTPEITTPEATTPEATTPEETTPESSDNPGTNPNIPDDFSLKKTFSSDSGTFLNIKAILTATEDGGKVRVVVELYLDHYSLNINGRKYGCKLNFGDVKGTYSTDKFEIAENKHCLTPLHMIEGTFEYGETYDLYASFPANCTYGGVELETLIISESITLE